MQQSLFKIMLYKPDKEWDIAVKDNLRLGNIHNGVGN